MAEVVDQSDVKGKSLPIYIENINGNIYIMPHGYGDATTAPYESGCPVMIEMWEGELRIVVWSDINKEDATHIISLEGARENRRVEA